MGITKKIQMEQAEKAYKQHLREVEQRLKDDGLDPEDAGIMESYYDQLDTDD